MSYESKIINDPVFGFIKIPKGLLYNLVRHPLLQRLTRIKQLGLSSVVYPGAQHTRFQHSLGAYYLMSEAIQQLTAKGNFIFDSEAEAVQAAILLHDVGHGPFSHVLEDTIVQGISHEEISLLLMERINREMNGQLALAIRIFRDEYPKRFLHQLVSGQLDMDRLDYLRRDSFYTGVTEGNIGSARIIKMLDVKDDQLVVEAKGIYSIENFLMARRLMYWQVYLHKTSVAYERMLISTLLRAKELAARGEEVFASPKSKAAKRLVFQGERKVALMKSKRCVRIVFTENSSFEPVIANMVLECRASVNILLADTKDIGGIARGQMVLQLPEDEQTAEKMIAYLKERNLAVEELTDYVE